MNIDDLFFSFFQRSEPLGVLVIERCTVELDLEEDAVNSFVLGKQSLCSTLISYFFVFVFLFLCFVLR